MSRRRTRSGIQREWLRLINQAQNDEDILNILGVDETCTVEVLESKFRKLSLQIHPDKNKECDKQDANTAMKKMLNARDRLKKRIEWNTAHKAKRKAAPRESSAADKAAKENAEKERAAREKAARAQAAREKAAKEQAARERAAKEQAAREKAAREKAARARARKRAAREEAAREKTARENAARSGARANHGPSGGTQDSLVSEAFKRELIQMALSRWLPENDDPAMRAMANELISAVFQSNIDSAWLKFSQFGLLGLFVYLKATQK